MKNEYKIDGNVAIIFVKSPKYGLKEILVDLNDFYWINQEIPGRICVAYYPDIKDFYAIYSAQGKYELLHRFIMNFPDGLMVDHINHNSLDNRSCNLRAVTNRMNLGNPRKKGTSEYPGVSWDKQRHKWRADIKYQGVTYYLGLFKIEEDAALAYQNAVLKLPELDKLPSFTGNPFLSQN
jgi:hypothetical protein